MNGADTTDFEIALTVWSIRAAMICFAMALFWRVVSLRNSTPPLTVRLTWLTGSLLALVHALAAMGFYHHWSHTAALEDTARQTEQAIGIGIGSGLYFNYVFVAVWLSDAIWWFVKPTTYESRPRWIHWPVFGFLIFIAINGTIVFETGVVRWFGIVVVIALGWILLNRWQIWRRR